MNTNQELGSPSKEAHCNFDKNTSKKKRKKKEVCEDRTPAGGGGLISSFALMAASVDGIRALKLRALSNLTSLASVFHPATALQSSTTT